MMQNKKVILLRRTLVVSLIVLIVMSMQIVYTYGYPEEDVQLTINLNITDKLDQPTLGYIYDSENLTLTFTKDSGDLDYNIVFTGGEQVPVSTIAFDADASPASITFSDIDFGISRGYGEISFPENFSGGCISFNNVVLGAELSIPSGFGAALEINNLTTPKLVFAEDYQADLVFNGITANPGGIVYQGNYEGSITITGNKFDVVNDKQFPQNYIKSEITIGGGIFDAGTHIISHTGTNTPSTYFINIPKSINTIVFKDAKTLVGGTNEESYLHLKLTAEDKDFLLLVEGDSDIKGGIEVPRGAVLTIDSKNNPGTGSSDGTLSIRTAQNHPCIGGNAEGSGQVVIKGGAIIATQAYAGGDATSAAIGGFTGNDGHVEITGGTVTAKSQDITGTTEDDTFLYEGIASYGAAIGGGAGGNGYVTIRGGKVYAAGNIGAAIGGGGAESGDVAGIATITIEDGYITAIAMKGACIGNGGIGDNENDSYSDEIRGMITITGGIIRGYGVSAANIGRGLSNGYSPEFKINKEADIYMTTRGSNERRGGIRGHGENLGDGFFVNMHTGYFMDDPSVPRWFKGAVHIYEASTEQFIKTLYIPKYVLYLEACFSTNNAEQEIFNIFVDHYDDTNTYLGKKQLLRVHDYDPMFSSDQISSVREMEGYIHQYSKPKVGSEAYLNDSLYVTYDRSTDSPSQYFRVKEFFVDKNGEAIMDDNGREYNSVIVNNEDVYIGQPENITDYIFKGYRWDSYNSDDPITPVMEESENPSMIISGDKRIYFVYEAMPTFSDVTVSKTVKGDFANKIKPFTFTMRLKDDTGTAISNKTFQVISGSTNGVTVPAYTLLTTDINGETTFLLKHNQWLTIKDLKSDSQIEIEETQDGGYDTSYTHSIEKNAQAFDFVNERKPVPIVGIRIGNSDAENLLFITMMILIISLFVLIKIRRAI